MNRSVYLIRSLFEEMNEWATRRIISESQRSRIEDETTIPDESAAASAEKRAGEIPSRRTETPRGKDRAREPINIARVVIGLASFCLSVGIVIFCAADWRNMSPVAKIIQVFSLIVSVNGLSFYLLSRKNPYTMLGRALLLVGMICYGAGIMLIAQIYHISAEPSAITARLCNRRRLLNIAIAGFILHAVVRNFDLFWDMLSGSLLFIVTGVIGLTGDSSSNGIADGALNR